MEPLHVHTEELPQDPLSDFSIWRRLIEYRKEVQWGNILKQVEELESILIVIKHGKDLLKNLLLISMVRYG